MEKKIELSFYYGGSDRRMVNLILTKGDGLAELDSVNSKYSLVGFKEFGLCKIWLIEVQFIEVLLYIFMSKY